MPQASHFKKHRDVIIRLSAIASLYNKQETRPGNSDSVDGNSRVVSALCPPILAVCITVNIVLKK